MFKHSRLGLGAGRAVTAPLLTTQAKLCKSMLTRHWPTIWPESLIPYTWAGALSGLVLRPFHKNSPDPGFFVVDEPTTSPESLMATTRLLSPPKVSRSIIVPLLHTNAWSGWVKHFCGPPYFC